MSNKPTLFHGDCYEMIPKIEDASIDLVLTDPPFNISRENNFATMKSANRQGVDFGEWDKNRSLKDSNEWISTILPKIKVGGSLVIFNGIENIGYIINSLEELSQGQLEFKRVLIWEKNNPMPANRDRLYVNGKEMMIWLVKNGSGKKKGKWIFNRKRTNYENGIFKYPAPGKSIRIHPTQKPEALIKELMDIHSNKGSIVCDPFMGSGVVGKVALENGRKFIGIEKDETYFNNSLAGKASI